MKRLKALRKQAQSRGTKMTGEMHKNNRIKSLPMKQLNFPALCQVEAQRFAVCRFFNRCTKSFVAMTLLWLWSKGRFFRVTVLCLPIMLGSAACTYNPVIDTAGRSGTFESSKAERITDDTIMCKQLAKKNTTFLSNINHWILSPKAETEYEHIVKTCMTNRGHSILK